MNKNENLTWSDIKEMFAEISRQFKETTQELNKQRAEVDKQRAEADKRRAEADEKHNKELAESNERLKKLEKLVGGIANSNGEMAEEFFYNTFKRNKIFVNEKFDKIRGRFWGRGEDNGIDAEYDIFLYNGKNAAIIEVKYNAKPDNINIEALIARVELFKTHFPEFKNHYFYLGVAAMAFKKRLIKELHQAGIATVHQIGKKMVVYDKDVKVF
jgi:hypothetical protein